MLVKICPSVQTEQIVTIAYNAFALDELTSGIRGRSKSVVDRGNTAQAGAQSPVCGQTIVSGLGIRRDCSSVNDGECIVKSDERRRWHVLGDMDGSSALRLGGTLDLELK